MKLEQNGFCQAHSNFKAAILFGKFDTTKISWDESVMNKCKKGSKISFDSKLIITSHYRPYCKQNLYPPVLREGLLKKYIIHQ
jgi:predicted helicase